MNRRGILLGAGAALMLGSCVYAPPSPPAYPPGFGPPPHAPAQGYRYHHPGGVVLVYDAGLGLYVVSGWPQHYFYDGRFYRLNREDWEWSPSMRGPWHSAHRKALPPGLRRR